VQIARFLKTSGEFESATKAKRVLSAAVKQVAAALGNTAAVCRKSYVHPAVTGVYLAGGLSWRSSRPAVRPSRRV
jgi:DNA topoisomerase I